VSEVDSKAEPESECPNDIGTDDPLGGPPHDRKWRASIASEVDLHSTGELEEAGLALAEDRERADGSISALNARGCGREGGEPITQIWKPADGDRIPLRIGNDKTWQGGSR
jgi:hypothetical protein